MLLLIIAGLLWFFPRQSLEWCAALTLAGVAAWLTVETHGIAPLGPFEAWFMADYILIQIIFSLFDRHSHAKV